VGGCEQENKKIVRDQSVYGFWWWWWLW